MDWKIKLVEKIPKLTRRQFIFLILVLIAAAVFTLKTCIIDTEKIDIKSINYKMDKLSWIQLQKQIIVVGSNWELI